MLVLAIPVAVGIAVFMLLLGIVPMRNSDPVRARLSQISNTDAPTLRALELQVPLFDRTVKPLAARLASIGRRLTTPSRVNQTEERLAAAGYPGGMTASDFLGLKVALGSLLGLLGFAVIGVIGRNLIFGLLLGGAFLAIGFIGPEFWLGGRVRARKRTILKTMPDILDILTISIRAGLGFDAALTKLIEKAKGPLSDEFRRCLAEIRLGKSRRDALRDMVDRVQVPSLTGFIGAILQAELLGVPVARVLQVQSEQLRLERRQRAEENAARAPIKMLLPLIGCVFPAMFIVILGPAVIVFMQHFTTHP